MAEQLSDEEREEFRSLFNSIDTDGGGQIDIEELAQMMEMLGRPASREKLQSMMAEVDTDGGGNIDFDEFCQLVVNQSQKEKKLTPLEEAKKAFELFDKDGSGTIDAAELGDALRAMGQNVDDEEVKTLLSQADDDGTGEIDFEEYCRLIGIAPEQPKAKTDAKVGKIDPHKVLTKDEIKEFTEIFNLFDEDASGEITIEELGKMMEALGRTMSEEQLKAMVASVDDDGTGSIEIEEFLIIMARDKANQDPLAEAKKIFAMFDKDGSGTIDATELGDALRAMGQQIADDDVAELLKQADDDGTGEIDFEEFCSLMGLGASAPTKPQDKAKRKQQRQQMKNDREAKAEEKEQRISRKQLERQKEREEAEERKKEEARIQSEGQNEWAEFLKAKAPRLGQKDDDILLVNNSFNYDYLMHKAAAEGDVAKVKELCVGKGTNKLDPDQSDDMGWTPMVWAITKGQLEVFMYLLQRGVKIALVTRREAQVHQNFEQILLRFLGGIKKGDFDGRNALHHAAMEGQVKMVKLLLSAEAPPDANKLDKYGDAALHWAAKRGYKEVAQVLIDGKADMNVRARHNETPLHWAAKRGQTAVCELLVEAKANIRAQDDAKTRPLDWAKTQDLKDFLDPKKRAPPAPPADPAATVRQSVRARKRQEDASSKFKQGLSAIKQTSSLLKTGSVKRKQSATDGSLDTGVGTPSASQDGDGFLHDGQADGHEAGRPESAEDAARGTTAEEGQAQDRAEGMEADQEEDTEQTASGSHPSVSEHTESVT